MNHSFLRRNDSPCRLVGSPVVCQEESEFATPMSDPANPTAHSAPPRIDLEKVLSAVGSERRWFILRELAKGEALPVIEIARRLGATPAGTSKHFAVLFLSGIVRRTYGGLYEIDPRFRVPGQSAIDVGHAYLRFD